MHGRELLDTLQKLIKVKVSQQNLANVLGVRQGAISNRIARNSEFTYEELRRIEEAYGIVGGLTGSALDVDLIEKYEKYICPPQCVELYYYPDVFGSCGEGGMVFNETAEKVVVSKSSIPNFSKSNHYSIISARGSSMYPAISDNDQLIIQHNVENQIIDDTIYLFKYNDELFIKRLVKNVDQIVCISENPRFQDRIIEPKGDNFSIIGKVVGLFRSKV